MEEIRICAFFDALGTREIMMGSDPERRHQLIQLIRRLDEKTSSYSPNVQNLGLGVVMTPSSQTTSFSDNVAVSFPVTTYTMPGKIGNKPHDFTVEANQFFEHLLIQIISAVWDGLKIGVLFRGGISVGRLVHDDKIIAGEALVKSVELEKKTKFPRIEIDKDVLEIKDDKGNHVINESIKEALECINGHWYVNVLDLHIGYWRDHNWYRQQEGKNAEEITLILSRIKQTLHQQNKESLRTGKECIIEKWTWFIEHYNKALQTGNWKLIDGACKEIIIE